MSLYFDSYRGLYPALGESLVKVVRPAVLDLSLIHI